jgi:ATP-dependent DNA helicase RecQ
MNRSEAERILRERFGLSGFYDEQWVAIERILRGERVLLIEKTGFGKSLCFQFPALVFDGVTVIFSPLIALMRDQVKKLKSLGIEARCINSEQTDVENAGIIHEAKTGRVKILYIAPERQENSSWIEATRALKLAMIVVDEAHCISAWGHDFRPAFRRIINLVKLLPRHLPVLATTATATKKVECDIAEQMGGDLTIIRGNLMRSNFRLFVIQVSSEDEKLIWLGKHLQKIPGSGIIYTGTRNNTEIYTRWLSHLDIPCAGYNAGLDPESRIAVEAGLMNNQWKCVISTNALGMGIDKPDIRFIIHTQIPQSPVHYYQEIGRAGRDGEPAWIILFYNPKDRDLPEAFIEGSRPPVSTYERVIGAVKLELLGEKDLMRRTNLRMGQIRVIKADLMEQKIVREVTINGRKKLEFIANAPVLDTRVFEALRESKLQDLDRMIGYVETTGSRMKFLCSYLGDVTDNHFTNCDNTGLRKLVSVQDPVFDDKLIQFRSDYFPELEVELKKSRMTNGVASSFYGVSNTGEAIHRCKYEDGGDFPEFLVQQTIAAFYHKLAWQKFDLVLYVPPTKSGDLVRNFAGKIAEAIRIPISHNLVKIRATAEQKSFENGCLKTDNVKNAFLYDGMVGLKGKSVLLIDDVFDSGATMKEIGRYLTTFGVEKVTPLVIAKTVGGDI